ncbi:MAG: DUF2800 domain-containing protein [Chloroflexi bacterium]|nr:MAG: DUF2800 domain-containing protein [Chloroflexota bacterium]
MSTLSHIRPSYMGTLLNCEGSVRLSTGCTSAPSPAAERGTVLHELAHHCLLTGTEASTFVGQCRPLSEYRITEHDAEQVQAAVDYVDNLRENKALFAEHQVNFRRWVPAEVAHPTGTADIIMIGDNRLTIVDYKFGSRYVDVTDNKQLLFYALGAYDEFGLDYDFDLVEYIIVQPALDSYQHYSQTLNGLLREGEKAKEYLIKALSNPTPRYNPGTDACVYCLARHRCKAMADYTENLLKKSESEALSVDVLAQILDAAPAVKSFLDAVESEALSRVERGDKIPGYKIVESRTRRKYADDAEPALAELLGDEAYKTDLISVTEAEKKLGKKHVFFKEHVIKPQGKPTIAPETDKRPEISLTPAIDSFTDLDN